MADLRELEFTAGEAAFITALSQAEVDKAVDEGWFISPPRRVLEGLTRRRFGAAELVYLRLVKDVGDWAVLHTSAKKHIHERLRERLPDMIFARGDELLFVEFKVPQLSPQSVMKQLAQYVAQFDVPAEQFAVSEQSLGAVTAPPVKTLTLPEGAEVQVIVAHPDTDHMMAFHYWARSVAQRLEEPIRVSRASLEASGAWEEIAGRVIAIITAGWAVVSDPGIRGGEPVVRGTRIPAHLLHDLKRQGATIEELLEDYPALDEPRLKAALLYAETHPRRGRPRKGPWHGPVVP